MSNPTRPIGDLEYPTSSLGLLTKAAADALYAPFGSVGGGASAWGAITGTLASQTDLATALNAKQATIAAGTTAQYWRGDKTFQNLDKTAVGLNNVDNTSDASKPVSTATLAALAAKQPLSTQLTNFAGASWSGGTQVVTLTAANAVSLISVGAASGCILSKDAADTLYAPIGSGGGGGISAFNNIDGGAAITTYNAFSGVDGGSASSTYSSANVVDGGTA